MLQKAQRHELNKILVHVIIIYLRTALGAR